MYLALKILGGLSVAIAGITGAYFLLEPMDFSSMNESSSSSETWQLESDSQKSNEIKVIVKRSLEKNGSKIESLHLECSIVPKTSKTEKLNLDEYHKILEEKLEIIPNKKSSNPNLKQQREKFIEKCKGDKQTSSSKGIIKGTIELETENKTGKKDQLQFKDFEKIFK